MIQIDKMSRKPIYEQIVEQIELQLMRGIIKDGDKLPSVRELSSLLGVNPNTIQKAYLELDRRKITSSSPGLGSFVANGASDIVGRLESSRLSELEAMVSSLALANISKQDILDAVNRAYRQYETRKEQQHDNNRECHETI